MDLQLSFRRPFQVQRQQARQDLLIRETIFPTVGGEDGAVELAVGVVQPGVEGDDG